MNSPGTTNRGFLSQLLSPGASFTLDRLTRGYIVGREAPKDPIPSPTDDCNLADCSTRSDLLILSCRGIHLSITTKIDVRKFVSKNRAVDTYKGDFARRH